MSPGAVKRSAGPRKRLATNEVPDLGQLAQTFSGGEARPAAQRAEPEVEPTPKPRPEPEPTPAGLPEFEVKVAISTSDADDDGSSTEAAEKLDEEASTREYQAVNTKEEVRTNLYNPSVARLLDKLTKPEVAAVEDPVQAGIRQMIHQIENNLADLTLLKHAREEERAGAVAEAQLIADEALMLLEGIPTQDQSVAGLHKELRALHEMYQGVIQELLPKEAAPKRKPKPKEKPLATAEREVIKDFRRSNRRRNILLGLVGLLIAGRVALVFIDGESYGVEHAAPDERTRTTVNHAAGATEQQLASGIPSVVEVLLRQEPSGALRARALTLDPDGDPVTLSFTWLQGDRVVEIEPDGLLAASQIKAGATYRVRVTASDGKHGSEPVTTAPFQASGPGTSSPE